MHRAAVVHTEATAAAQSVEALLIRIMTMVIQASLERRRQVALAEHIVGPVLLELVEILEHLMHGQAEAAVPDGTAAELAVICTAVDALAAVAQATQNHALQMSPSSREDVWATVLRRSL